jgi:dethiobiotin synthetase
MSLPPIQPLSIPGLLIAGAEEKIGKTVIAAAIADWFRRDRARASVFKPFDMFCEHRREGWVSEDAEFLATASRTQHPLDLIAPIRANTKQPPALLGEAVSWELVDRSIAVMSRDADVMVVEPTPGLLDPIEQDCSMLDVASAMKLKAVLVVQASQSLHRAKVNLLALRSANIPISGIVVNRYPPGTASAIEEQFPRILEKLGKVRVLTIIPEEPIAKPFLPPGIIEAIGKVDWRAMARGT